jgi:hypothetical protein
MVLVSALRVDALGATVGAERVEELVVEIAGTGGVYLEFVADPRRAVADGQASGEEPSVNVYIDGGTFEDKRRRTNAEPVEVGASPSAAAAGATPTTTICD